MAETAPTKAITRGLMVSPLTEELLMRFESRAATYDRENRFFDQDFSGLS